MTTAIKPYRKGGDEPFEGYEQQNAVRQQIGATSEGAVQQNVSAMGRVTPGHVKRWDPVTAGNLERLEDLMAMNPPKRAWVMVLHPWPISVNGGRMMRETAPGAGLEIVKEGELLVHRHRMQGGGKTHEPDAHFGVGILEIPWYEPDMKPEENGSHSANPVYPIEQAEQYAREGNNNALWGPGVIIYDGDMHPAEMWASNAEVSLFDPMGRPITEQKTVNAPQRGTSGMVPRTIDVPVTGKFREVFQQMNEARLAHYLGMVNEANGYYVASEGKEKKWYTNRNTAKMAQVLFRLKRIASLPEWAMESRLDAPAQPAKKEQCISCHTERNGTALKCGACGWPFDSLAAYEAGLIEFEHVSISALPIKELEKAYQIKQQRGKAKQKMEEKFAKKAE